MRWGRPGSQFARSAWRVSATRRLSARASRRRTRGATFRVPTRGSSAQRTGSRLVPSPLVTKSEIRARTPTSEPRPGYLLVMSRGNVLVVDDEPTIAEVVGGYLERAGYTARIAHDGRAAL